MVTDDTLYHTTSYLLFQFPLLCQYVDEINCAIPDDEITSTLELLNLYNPKINFTIERESYNSVSLF